MNRKWAAVVAALAVVAGLVQASEPVRATPSVNIEDYVRRDGYGRIQISPDGQHYAATVQLEDRGGLVIFRRADNQVVGGATGEKHSLVDRFWWAKNDRVVLSTAEKFGSHDQPYATGALFSVGVDGSRVRTLVGPKTEAGLVQRVGDTGPWEMASLIDTLPDDPANVLIAAWDMGVNPKTRIEKLDVYTGRRSTVASAPVRRASFVTDVAGQVRFAGGAGDDNRFKLFYRDSDAGEWRLVSDQAQTGLREYALGFSADSVTAYLQVAQAQGPDAIVAWNTRTGERTEIQRDPTVDPYDTVYDRDGRTLLGLQYMGASVQTRLFDETTSTAKVYRALAKAFPDAALTITSYTRDGRHALVQAWNDRTPGDTFLFDTEAMTAKGVYAAREWFDPARLAAVRAVSLKARDGLALRGYLTPPRDAGSEGPWPTVVMPHGGPFGIFDTLAFDDDAHLLSEAGYAVLRINYRGSGNHGLSFRQAGAQEWGGKMQDDLTDATRWAIETGVADASRICIVGASYGGYAALMGAAREPDLYRCAVGYVGVYDLETMHREDSRSARWLRTWANEWLGERDSLKARSPIHMAGRITAPVLLVAGGEDRIAPIAHSKKMERALRAAGKPVETFYVSSEGHGFYADDNRREYMTRLLEFLARHLGGRTAAEANAGRNRKAAAGG
jgi:dipeptidyl aminopeptidase/acylaminoacyl peptidase